MRCYVLSIPLIMISPVFVTLSRCARNRRFPVQRMAPVKLVHGNVVHHYQGPQARPHADAVFTALRGQGVGVVTADCLPLLLASCGMGAMFAACMPAGEERPAALSKTAGAISPASGGDDVVVVCGPHIHARQHMRFRPEFYQLLLTMPAGELAKRYNDELFHQRLAPETGQAQATGNDNLVRSRGAGAAGAATGRGGGGKYRMAGKLYLLHAAGARLLPSAHPFSGGEKPSVFADYARIK